MNIHEFQAKVLLGQHGVTVPKGKVFTNSESVREFAQQMADSGVRRFVIKSQIYAGGRGKGTFNNGFKAGVKALGSVAEIQEAAEKMLGAVLVTKQTGPEGKLVSKVLLEPAPDIQ